MTTTITTLKTETLPSRNPMKNLAKALLTLLLLFAFSVSYSATTYWSRQTGNWNQNSTWSTVACSNATNTGTFPVAGDIVYICSGHTVTLTANAACTTLDVTGTLALATKNINVSGATTISGSMTNTSAAGNNNFKDLTINSGGSLTNTGNDNFTVSGNFQNDGTFSPGTGKFTFTGAGKTLSGSSGITAANIDVNGTYTNNTTLTVTADLGGSGTLTQGSGQTLNLSGTSTINAITATVNPNTVNYKSTTSAQTVFSTTYHHLTFNNTGRVATLANTTTVNGDLTITSGTLQLGNRSITVSGSTSITGTLDDDNGGGTNSFQNITVNSGGTFSSTGDDDFSIAGNLQNDGTITSGAGTYTFTGASKTFSGANAVTIDNVTVSGTYTNNGTLTVATALAGAGTLTQGTNSTLYVGGTFTTTSFTATANPNTVCYNSTSGGQTVRSTTYHHLTIDKSGQTGTLGGAVTVNGNLTLTAGTLNDGGYQITGNATGTLSAASGTTLTLGSAATATTFPTNFTSGNISLNAASTVNYNSNAAQTISATPTYGNLTLTASGGVTKTLANAITVNGTLTIGTNNTLADAGYTITAKGAVTNNATHSGAGKIYLNGGAGSHTVSGGTATFGNVELNDANGASWSGTGTTTVSGNLTITAGTLSMGAFTTALSVSGGTGISGTLSTTSTTGTKTYTNITVNNGGTWSASVAENFTVNGNIQNDGTFTGNTGTYTCAGAAKTFSGNNSINIPNLTVSGTYTNNGTVTVSTALAGAGTLTQGANSTLNIGGTSTVGTLTATANPNTVNYNRTTGGQTVFTTTYHHLTFNNTGQTATLGGNTTVNGNLTITTGTLELTNRNFSVAGNASVSGTLSDNNNTGTNSLLNLTINSGGTFSNTGNSAFTINGNLQNDGTLTAGSGVYTFAGAAKTISGTNTVTIPSATIGGTYTNNGTFTVSTALAGAGTLTQGTNSSLNVGGTFTTTNFTATASPNTVTYTSTSAGQTVRSTTYHHLAIDKSGQTGTLGGAVTVNGNLTLTAGTLDDGGFQITGNATGTLSAASGTTLTLGSAATATVFPTSFTGANINLNVASTVNYNSNAAQTISAAPTYGNLTLTASGGVTKTLANNIVVGGTLTIGTNNTLSDAAGYIATVKGNLTNNGTHSGAGKIYLNSGSGSHTISGGTATFGNMELNDANGASWSGTGTTTVSGNITLTAGTLSMGAFTTALSVSGSTSISGTLATTSTTGTKTYTNITVNSGGTWNSSVAENFTVNGNIQNDGTFTANTGTYTCAGAAKTFSGTVAISIPNLTVSGTYTNNGTLTVSTALAGAGTLTQGTNSSLNVGGTFTTTNFTATANPNTVTYNSTTAGQTLRNVTYHHLAIDKSGQTGTLAGATTVNGNLTLTTGTLDDGGFQITGNATGTLSAASGTTLTLGSAATATAFPTSFTAGNIALNAASTVNYNSNAAQTISATPTYGNLTLTASGGVTKTLANAITVNGTLTIGTNNTLADAGYTLTAKGAVTNNATHSGAGKIYLNGGAGSHTISGGTSSFGNLELNDANGASWSGTGTTTMSGALTITTGTMATGAFTTGLSVSGSTSISGTLSTTSTTGSKTYTNITVNSGGTWNSTVAENFTINGNLQNDGTFTANTGTYTFAGAGKTLSGTSTLSIPNTAVTGTYTNNGTLTVSTALTGAGTLTQGSNSALNLGGTATITTLTATANPNTVTYTGTSGGQTINATTYHHLTVNNSGQIATLSGNAGANGNFNITTGTFAFGNGGDYTMSVTGNVTVNSGATMQYTGNSTRQHTLNITGNLTNAGTVNIMRDKDDFVALVFQGSGNSLVSGSGTWTSLAYMTMNKSSKTDTVYLTSAGFASALTTGSAVTDKPYAAGKNPSVIFTKGTFRYNLAETLSNLIDPNATGGPSLTINSNVAIKIEQGLVEMAYYSGVGTRANCILQGTLEINGGTVSVDKASNDEPVNGLFYEGTSPNAPVFIMTGGTLNVYGGFSSNNGNSDDIRFTMSAGTITTAMGAKASNYEGFWLTDHAGSYVNWTGGTIRIDQHSKYVSTFNDIDFDIGGTVNSSWTVSGNATVRFGTTSIPRSETMRFMAHAGVVYPHFVVADPGGGDVVTVCPYNNSNWKLKSLVIQTNQVFDMRDILTSTDTHTMRITEDNGSYSFYNDGTFTARNGTVVFDGTAEQPISGSTATAFYGLDFENDCKLEVNISSTGTLTQNAITDLNSKTLTLGTSAASTGTLVYTSGRMYHGTFKRWFATTAVANGDDKGLFPMGTSSGDNRPFRVSYPSALAAGGSISLVYNNATSTTDVSITDGAALVVVRHDAYWTTSTTGFAGVGGTPFNIRGGGTSFDVGDINDLRLVRAADVIGTAGTNLGSVSDPIVVRNGLSVTDLSNNHYMGSTNKNNSPLPVTLIDFTASQENGTVTLNWSTASEINNDYFTVERSKDGMNFEALTRVNGAGNSNRLINYSVDDTGPFPGTSFYRLKQTDYNGNSQYSYIVTVDVTVDFSFSYYPNPLRGSQLYITCPESALGNEITIGIYDLNGRTKFLNKYMIADKLLVIDIGKELHPGLYMISFSSKESVYKNKLIIR